MIFLQRVLGHDKKGNIFFEGKKKDMENAVVPRQTATLQFCDTISTDTHLEII